MNPPRFIVLEGPDGSGTTTHARLLVENLQADGRDVVLTAEPTNGQIGSLIRSMLQQKHSGSPDVLQLLFCADRAEHVATVIVPALGEGKTIVCDRYALSTIVYGKVMGLDEHWLRQINAKFPVPDITIITLPSIEVCRQRLRNRQHADSLEEDGLQSAIHEYYRRVSDPATIIVDTSDTQKNVATYIAQKAVEGSLAIQRQSL